LTHATINTRIYYTQSQSDRTIIEASKIFHLLKVVIKCVFVNFTVYYLGSWIKWWLLKNRLYFWFYAHLLCFW